MTKLLKNLILLALLLVASCTKTLADVPPPQSPVEDESASSKDLPEPVLETPVESPSKESPSKESPSKEEVSEPQETVRALCETEEKRRPWPTKEQKVEARSWIRATCKAMGVSTDSCNYFLLVSLRESSYRWWVRHKKHGDTAAAVSSYLSSARRYGWEAEWPRKGRQAEDLSQIVLTPREGEANPYYPDVERWLTGGLGLGGLNVGYHLQKIDPMAPPEILCDPILNTMVQITIARRAVRKYKAQNWLEVQAVYAGRTTYDDDGKPRAKHVPDWDRKLEARCDKWGLDCHSKPQLGSKINLDRMSPEEIYEAAEEIRGAPLPEFDEYNWEESPAQIQEPREDT